MVLDIARARKNSTVNSFSDTITMTNIHNECKAMVQQYDNLINGLIESDGQISIEVLLEYPAMIASEMIEGGCNDNDVRR